MQPKQCIAIINSIKSYAKQNPTEAQVYEDWFQAVVNLRDAMPQDKRFDAYKYSGELRSVCAAMMGKMKTGEDVAKVYDIISRTYLFEAKDVFDSYCIYLEWNRAPEKKFYQPRRKVLKVLADDLEDLFYKRIDFLGVSLPARVGKSTLCIFFITWLMGNRPDVASVMSGHSDKLTNGFYGEVLSIITDPVTYNWGKIFPDVQLVDKSAKDESVDLNRKKRFPTLTCRSIGGTLTGAVEIGEGGVLYSDDLIEDLEESLNVERLNNKYDAYLNQLKDRKKQGALELMVGTRWNVLDPLGRIQNQYADNPKYRFRVIPAVDENGHSNFNYDYGVGFDDAYYADMKASIDDIPRNYQNDLNDLICVYTPNQYFEIDNGKVTKSENHSLGMLPMVEYKLNPERMGLFEPAIPVLDAINDLESNRLDGVAQFIQSIMVFTNCLVDKDDFNQLKELGAVCLKSTSSLPASVSQVANELDQQQSQTLLDSMLNVYRSLTAMPSATGSENATSDNVGAVIVRNGWNHTEARAQQYENMFKYAERQSLSVMLKILRDTAGSKLMASDINIKLPRRQYDNQQSKVQIFAQMLGQPIDPQLAFTTPGLFPDPQAAYEMSKPFLISAGKLGEDGKAPKPQEQPKQGATGTNAGNMADKQPNNTD